MQKPLKGFKISKQLYWKIHYKWLVKNWRHNRHLNQKTVRLIQFLVLPSIFLYWSIHSTNPFSELSSYPEKTTAGLSCFSHIRLWDPMDCSPPGSSVLGILQARILEWVAMPSSKESSWPRNQASPADRCLLHLLHCRQILYHWVTCESHRETTAAAGVPLPSLISLNGPQ